MLQAGYNHTGRYNGLSETTTSPAFTYSPEFLTSINYKVIKSKTTFSIYYKYNGKLPGYALVNSEVVQTTVADYNMMDLTVSQLFWKDKINLVLGCKNLFDVKSVNSSIVGGGAHSSSSSSVPLSTGKNYFIKLALNF